MLTEGQYIHLRQFSRFVLVPWSRLSRGLVFSLTVFSSFPSPALAHGALHERIAEIKSELATQPENTALRFQLASVYCQHGDWYQTLEESAQLERLAPKRYPADLLIGQALLGLRRLSEAKSTLDRFLLTEPKNPQALVTRARVHRDLGDPVSSLRDYQASLASVGSPHPELAQEIADAYALHHKTDEALRVLDQAIARFGSIPSLVNRALDIEVALARHDAALGRILSLQQSAPRPEPWMMRRVQLLAEAGRMAEARAAAAELRAHLDALPNLDRGSAPLLQVAEELRLFTAAFDGIPRDSGVSSSAHRSPSVSSPVSFSPASPP